MDFLRKHRKICSAVAALMVAVLVVYSFGSFRSYAAAPEVSTLPADIDIDVTYDADTVNFTYAGKAYSIDRKHKVNLTHYRYSSNRYVRDDNYPEFFEYRFDGYSCYTSYWFSPSEMRVYVLIGWHSYSKVKSYLPSPKYGTFRISDTDSDIYYYMTTIDYGSGSAIYNKMSSKEAIDYWDAQVSSYDDSRDRSSDNVYACRCNLSSFNYYYTSYLKDGFLVRTYMDYKASGELDTSDYASNYHYIPNDLLCIFSNYEISGFYEPDTSKVSTPDYYFNYQYIFYKEGYGYIFVDSAKRCKEVGFPSGVTNPRFYFDGEGNNYVYTSVDGITWILKSTYSTMYNSQFGVSCGYDFTNYTLVYTNDKNFGTPLVTPSYGSLSDITGDLPDISHNYGDNGNGQNGYTVDHDDVLDVTNPFFTIIYGITSSIDSDVSSGVAKVLSYILDVTPDALKDNTLSTLLLQYNELTSRVTYDYVGTLNGKDYYNPRTTIYGFVSDISLKLSNVQWYLNSLRTLIHSDLKSVFDNITLSNQYLKRIFDNLDSLSIPAAGPDYSGNFDKLSAALDRLHNDLIYEEGVTKLPNVPQYLVYIYGVTNDIRTRLDSILSALSNDFSKPYSMGTYLTLVYNKLSSFNDMAATKLDAVIAKIPSTSGGGSFDDSNMVGSIVSLKADISDNFTTLIKLLKNDTDDITDFKDLSEFLTSYIVSMGNAAYFTTLLDFADGVKNNVVLINGSMSSMVSDSGIYAPVFVLGAGFAVFSGLIRKERMS